MIKNADLLLDVRTPQEYASGHLDGAINIPHDQILARLSEIEQYKDSSVVLYCKVGGRASQAQAVLIRSGFSNVINAGGYDDLLKFK